MYDYQALKPFLLTDEGQKALISSILVVKVLCTSTGNVQMETFISYLPYNLGVWQKIAVIERLVELGYLIEIPTATEFTQHRMFRWGHNS